jgi:hypothetical protein
MKIKSFTADDKFKKYVTRITDYNSVLEFVKHKKLHFSPLSSFEDFTEGKRFEEITLSEEQEEFDKNNSASALFRRKVMYASCWYSGGESLHMWNLYGRNERYLAIQVERQQLVNLFSRKFKFESESYNTSRITKDSTLEFKPGSLHYGKVEYVNLLKINKQQGKLYIGRFKDKAFQHEKEFRLLMRQNYKDSYIFDVRDLKCRFNETEFKQLKLKIIVSPRAPHFYFEMIKNQLKDHHHVEVIESKFKKLFTL